MEDWVVGEWEIGRVGEWGGVGWGGREGLQKRRRQCGEAAAALWRHAWRGDVERRACAESAHGSVSGYEGAGAERERDMSPRAEGAEGADLCVQVSDAGHDLHEEAPRLGLAAPPVLHNVLK